jgi:hypothetical protein
LEDRLTGKKRATFAPPLAGAGTSAGGQRS